MTWFKVDDGLHSHPKRHRAGLKAMGLWVVAGSWASDQLTDGFIPTDMLPVLGGRTTDARALVDAGLWDAIEGGWHFHDWEAQNPTRLAVEQRRAEDRERKAQAREARRLRVVKGEAS